ncbi:transporter [Sulfurifustis variabilis]|uniref:Transporter n=1 Tax=Sulfurifustis variabilis TaxID=1675686 RepID=A0A1B4UZS9_9GAMM|nr:efflux RND transporter permease subunit [Sulfurifustis variabilis]BAU46659.1 transporter [Sulfurifustis variabilis]
MVDRQPDQAPNLAGRVARYFIDSKLTLLIVVVALLAGLLALLTTPREENPQIVVPAANIIVAKPGASPREVEQLIVKPLEAILQGLTGVEHTYGVAMDSLGVVSVQFFVGENKEDALVKLYDRIMSNLDRMPPGTRQPLVKPVDVDDVPILTISLASNRMDDRQLRRIATDALEHLRRADGVSASFIHGGRARRINVDLDLERMRRYNVTLLDIRRVLEATNVDIPSGTLVSGNTVSTVAAGGFLRSAEDVGNLVVALQQHRPVYLRQVATIVDGPGEIERVHRIGFGPAHTGARLPDLETNAVVIALAKRQGTNAVRVADAALAELEALKGTVIPDSVAVNVTRNDGERANAAVDFLMQKLAIAIATVVLLLVIFLGWRAASIVTITIPLILFITLVVGMLAGQSINRITLFALILSLGLLVDDSIVVIENIFRHYAQKGADRLKSAVAAVNEIGHPTNLATFTVILAFLPMLWVTGMMGPYMRPIPFNVPVAMITSLFIAYTVAPWLAYRWLRVTGGPHAAEAHEHAPGWLERGYGAALAGLLASRLARNGFFAAVAVLMAAVLAMPAFDLVLFRMLPKNDTNTFNITVDLPEGTALEETDRVARLVGDVVRAHPQVWSYETTVGESGVIDFNGLLRGAGLKRGPHVAEVRVNLRDKALRHASSIDIVLGLREPIARVAALTGANIKLVEDPPGPPVRATILAELYGPDYERLRAIAEELRREVYARTADVVDIDDSNAAATTEYRIDVNRERAALAGILPAQVAEALAAFLGGYDAGTVHLEEEKEPVAIRFQIPQSDRVEPSDLRKIFFVNPQGARVPITEIAEIRKTTAGQPIHHKDQRPVVYVTGELARTSQVYAVLDMWNYLRKQPLPSGVTLTQYFMADPDTQGYALRWDGEMRLTLDVFRDLGAAFAVAIVLIYLVLVGYYRSFAIPLIVMGAIPLTVVGVLPGHAIMGQHFTATSMIGVIALAGIVVRNSLLLIDFILEHERAGQPVKEAVLAAGRTRLRPILLTALAIILGTAIIITDPVFGGLAISLIFGTFASTALTLFVIPLIYFLYARRQGAAA